MFKRKNALFARLFTAEQVQQLATPTYRTRKEKEQKKTVSASPVSLPPLSWTLQKSLLGRVEGDRAGNTTETPSAGRKNRPDESPSPARGNPAANPRLMT